MKNRAFKLADLVYLVRDDLRTADVLIIDSFELKDDRPVYKGLRKMSSRHNQIVEYERKDAGSCYHCAILASPPSYSSSRKDGRLRFGIDYRIVNEVTKPDRWLVHKMGEVFGKVEGGEIFTALDGFSVLWRIKMEESCKEIFSFRKRFRTFQFEVVQFGLMSAPATVYKMLDGILREFLFAKAYLDDAVRFQIK